MKAFWLTFTDGSQVCCEGESAYSAKMIAEHLTGKTVIGNRYADDGAQTLPYPAHPLIWQFEHPVSGKCPPFCYTPKECAGRSSCPKNRACSE